MTARRYRPGVHYRRPFGLRAARAEKIIAVGLVVAVAASAHTATAHHHASRATATDAASKAAPAAIHAAPVTSGSETAFIAATLADLGAPDNAANVRSLADWFPHEYPSWPPWADNNPMSSTMPMPGAWAYNTLTGGGHVWNYPNAAEGAEATAKTLADGWYPQILAALRAGNGLCGNSSLDGEFLTWSGNGYSGVC